MHHLFLIVPESDALCSVTHNQALQEIRQIWVFTENSSWGSERLFLLGTVLALITVFTAL